MGCLLQCGFTLGCGLATAGAQILVFRALAGVASSFCLPSAVSIIISVFPEGRRRSMAFACMGGGQPLGFGIGLTLGGVLVDTIGWRWGFYIAAVVNFVILVLAAWQRSQSAADAPSISLDRLMFEIDWVGALLASSCLAMLSYVLAYVTQNSEVYLIIAHKFIV